MTARPLALPSLAWTPRRFAWTLQARGPALDTWPAPDRIAALALLRTDFEAQSLLAEALATEPAPDQDDPAQLRMQCRVRRALARPPRIVRNLGWATLAACLVAGLYLGQDPVETDLLPTMHASMPATVLVALDQ